MQTRESDGDSGGYGKL